MTKCMYCRKKTHMPVLTKCCSINVCIKCVSPEQHKCVNMQKFLNNLKEQHRKQLIDNTCISDKLDNRV